MGNLKIFHTADLHLGLRFSRYPDGLAEARFRSLERMVEKANQENCDLFVVAGDLFDTLQVAKRDVARAAKILSGFGKCVAVLPGNHDFISGANDEFWQPFLNSEHERLLLLKEGKSYSLESSGLSAVLYSAPCQSKYSKTHALASLEKASAGTFHIGVAHGSFEGLSPDLQGDYFPMKKRDLEEKQLDLWLLGHIHVPYPPHQPGANDRIFYSGTHEPDGFDCRHEGRAWLIELSADKRVSAKAISTGEFRFRKEELAIDSLQALEGYAAKFSAEEAKKNLLRLKFKGSLPKDEHENFAAAFEKFRQKFFHLEADFSELGIRLAPADIDRTYPQNSFPHRLLSELAQSEQDREALQAAFDLIQESSGRA